MIRTALLSLAAAVVVVFAAADPPMQGVGEAGAVQVDRQARFYDIAGRTDGELRAAMDRLGPLAPDGRRWDGYTGWQVTAEPRLVTEGDTCRVAGADVDVRVEVTLPRWVPPADADAGLIGRWQRFADALAAHEAGHERLARDAAQAIARRLPELPPRADCDAARAAAGDAAAGILRQARKDERAFDRRTRHGRRQGARFP